MVSDGDGEAICSIAEGTRERRLTDSSRYSRNEDESVSTPSARRVDKVEDTNQKKMMGEYSSPSLLKREELMQTRKAAHVMTMTAKTDIPEKKHRITPVMITGDEETPKANVSSQDGTKSLFQEYAEKAEQRGEGIDSFGEHWQTEGANDDSEGEQYCRRNEEGEIVPIEGESEGEGEESGSQQRGEESAEEVEEEKTEADAPLQVEAAAECRQLRQRVERLKREVNELKSEARIIEGNQAATENVTKAYKAKNAKLNKELKHNKETQLHLETQVQKTESEKTRMESLYKKSEKALEEQRVELEKEMRGYVEETAAAGLKDCQVLVVEMEELARGYDSRIEDMGEQLRQAQAETHALRGDKREESEDEPSGEPSSTDGRGKELMSLVTAQTAMDELQKDKEALMEQVEALRRENAELSDAAKHTVGSNEQARGEMEEKRIQIEQLQEEISRCKEAETIATEGGAAADAEIHNLLEKLEELDREKQSQRAKRKEKQQEHDTMVVEKENLAAEKESLKKELQVLREESSDKLRRKNEVLVNKMDKLKESNEIEQELINKQKTDMKAEIKGLRKTVEKMEAEIQEQKTEYHAERGMREQELSEAEAEISTMALSLKFEEDFGKLMKVLRQIGVSKDKDKKSGQEKPESQILNALEWYDSEALEAMCLQNFKLRARVQSLTRRCTREKREEAEGDNWDMTFSHGNWTEGDGSNVNRRGRTG